MTAEAVLEEYISTHILTKRMTAISGNADEMRNFNSHPHEEDDRIGDEIQHVERISTHILTKRMTAKSDILIQTESISTHILTKRMTVNCQALFYFAKYFNSHPHEEDDKMFL